MVIHKKGRGFSASVENGPTLDTPDYILAEARAAYPAWTEERRKKRLSEWREKLQKAVAPYSYHASPEDITRNMQSLDALWQEVPDDLRDALEETVAYLRELLTQRLEEARERKRLAEQTRQAAEQFVDWYKAEVAPFVARLQALKERWESQPFTVYRVTYGIVAEDEDGSLMADTQSFYTFSPQPDEKGYWSTLNGRRIRVAHLVSVEEMQATPRRSPWEVEMALSRIVISHGEPEDLFPHEVIRFPPTVSKETLDEIEREFTPPQAPDIDLPRSLWLDKAREMLAPGAILDPDGIPEV